MCVCFCDCLISRSIMSSRFIHVMACVWLLLHVMASFLRLDNIPLYVHTAGILSTCLTPGLPALFRYCEHECTAKMFLFNFVLF